MKLVWCPETASKAYIDAVKALADRDLEETNVAELVAAMAGGWKAQLIVEAWDHGDGVATSLGLEAAARHTRGRHVCVVPDERSAAEYVEVMRRAGLPAAEPAVVVGEAEEVMGEMQGVDFMVVDWRRRDAAKVLRAARAGPRGMVVVRKGAGRMRSGAAAMAAGTRLVKSAFLPIGRGLEVLHLGVGKGPSLGSGCGRWIKHVDRDTGEEHVFRR
ncbi:uncharacterized protein LOC103700322 [Phoenix dactylifera]|uniref:Uncharacterized protein LOC103700322 n=1 Tax=Phoenix dactylifera TaxID=42345 RepID=A0A8B7BL35_PHODC|nr:uncharacterized protein LOC103700322 [Phoenix dactylifera]